MSVDWFKLGKEHVHPRELGFVVDLAEGVLASAWDGDLERVLVASRDGLQV